MAVVLSLPDSPLVPVAGTQDYFPVGRIFCVGRNYDAHAREMGVAEREPPFFFSKFPDAILQNGAGLPYPPETRDFHYEGEMVVAIGKGGYRLSIETAMEHVFGYAAGLDMTRRDLQSMAKKEGKPWDLGKNFQGAAPIAAIHRLGDVGVLDKGGITLKVNDVVRQEGDIADMIWSVPETISCLSQYGPLRPGDLIYTGTPAGVGAVVPGDHIEVDIAGLTPLRIHVVPSV